MFEDGGPEIAVRCRTDGTIADVICDEIGLKVLHSGQFLAGIVSPGERWKAYTFLRRILDRGAALEHELKIPSQRRTVPLFFSGCKTDLGMVVIGSSKSLSKSQLCYLFNSMARKTENAIRRKRARPASTRHKPEREIANHDAELAALQNALRVAQREVIEKSVDLENERSDRSQELGMAVHGLRNPACSILTASEFLIEDVADALTAEQLTLLRGTARSALLILRMIENVLEISRAERGKVRMHFAPTDLVALVKEVVLVNQPQADRKGLFLETDFQPTAVAVELDSDKTTQVIDNLVGNAIRFSQPGGKIAVQIRSDDRFASISVGDEGPGIPKDRIKSIFEPFQCGPNSEGFNTGGTGLGLAVSKRIVDMHNGSIDLQTQVGKGSVFTLTLPMRMAGQNRLTTSLRRKHPNVQDQTPEEPVKGA